MIEQILQDFNTWHLAVILGAFLMGSLVKGISSFGLPTVSIPIMIMVLPLPTAVSVLAIPLILSNFVQMMMAGNIKLSVKRHWGILLPTLLTLPIGVYFLAVANTEILSLILGLLLILVTSLELLGVKLNFIKRHEKVLNTFIVVGSGIIGGMTSLFAIIPIFFFVALDLSKDRFVSVVSVLLCTGSIVLGISLERTNLLGPLEMTYGIIGMIPIIVGIWTGTQIRKKVDQVLFRKVVLALICIIGLSMVYRSMGAPGL